MNSIETILVYDGDCPFCSRYAAFLKFRETVGAVQLKNAREHPDIVKQLSAKGYDLDEGMALLIGDRIYFGDDCIHQLALMTTPSDAFNKLTGFVFKSERLSKALYPILRTGRNATLCLLGRKKING